LSSAGCALASRNNFGGKDEYRRQVVHTARIFKEGQQELPISNLAALDAELHLEQPSLGATQRVGYDNKDGVEGICNKRSDESGKKSPSILVHVNRQNTDSSLVGERREKGEEKGRIKSERRIGMNLNRRKKTEACREEVIRNARLPKWMEKDGVKLRSGSKGRRC
jgi:hypothetical protein